MLARLNGMARGGAGVSLHVFDRLLDMLNRRIHPIVPSRGSIGMSDLAPLAHMALPLIGMGEVEYLGRRMPALEALSLEGLEPVVLEAKDGLALCSANSASVGHGALVLAGTLDILMCADLVAAFSLEAFEGNVSLFQEQINAVRPHSGQLASAERMRALLAGSGLWDGASRSIQDPLSFRCVTQVHGACLDALAFVQSTVEIDLNSSGDNPVVLPQEGLIVSNGNFHPAGLAMGFDTLGIVLAQLTSLSTSRTIKLMDPELSGLPPQLTANPGINCGYGVLQKTVTALNAENRFLANPVNLDFVPVANAIEDHATMATQAVFKASRMLENLRYVLAIEFLSAAQAIDLRPDPRVGPVARAVHRAIREEVPFTPDDQIMATALEAVYKLVASGRLLVAANRHSTHEMPLKAKADGAFLA
jgi:histidine ammonia-lyase